MYKIVSLAVCVLLHLTQVYGDEASSDQKTQTSSQSSSLVDASNPTHVSRVKRAMDMRRLARGIQMLRLGKRSLPLLRLGKRSYMEEEEPTLEDLLSILESDYYDGWDYPLYDDEILHSRYRRSADVSAPEASHSEAESQHASVKRSVDFLPSPQEEFDDDGYFGDQDFPEMVEKRPMNMLRLGKRPMNMLRLGKRPMNMLRLGKRPMNMLRLGKRDSVDEELAYPDSLLSEPLMEESDDLNAVKRPMNMLRLGKRPMNMLRLGKRPMNMLRLGKRPMNMLRLGKRPMNMLRLGKRPMNMLRLGKRDTE